MNAVEFGEKLPEGWVRTSLENISTIILGQSPPSSTYNKEKTGLPFFQGKTEFGELHPVAKVWCDSPKKIAKKNDILISVRAPVGSTNISTDTCCIGRGLSAIRTSETVDMMYVFYHLRHKKNAKKNDILISVRAPVGSTNISTDTCCIGRGLSAIRTSETVDMMYVFYHLRHMESHIAQKGTGTTFKAITGKQLRSIKLSLPPLSEQKRIVVKIKSIFAQIDAAKERLERLVPQTKTASGSLDALRNSVLKQAFEGKLVLQNLNDESVGTALQKIHKISRIDLNGGKATLANWHTIQLEDYIKIAARIGWRGLKKSEYTRKGAYLLAVKDIADDGRILYDGVLDHLSDFRYEESPEIQIKKNDILITKDGTIGKVGFVHTVPQKTTVNSSILVVRPSKLIYQRYLFYYFKAPLFQKIVRDKIKGTAVPHLFQHDIKKFQINIAPFKEQKRIVTKIESIFAEIDAIEQSVKFTLQLLDQLKNSTLKQAFEGKLVPPDPNDEPAEFVLPKIK